MKTINILAEDKVGLLADISYILGKNNINIDGLNMDIVGKKAIISLAVKDHLKAREILQQNNYDITENDAIVVKISNNPGAVSEITNMLIKEKINVENLSVISSNTNEGVFALIVDKPRKANRILSRYTIGGY